MDFLSQLLGAFGMGGGFSPQTPAPGAPLVTSQDGANAVGQGGGLSFDPKKLQEISKALGGMFPQQQPGGAPGQPFVQGGGAPAAPQFVTQPMMQPSLLGSIQAPAYNPLSPLRPPPSLAGRR